MDGLPNIPSVPLPVKPIDPVERSVAKPDAFAKPASLTAKPAAKSQTRVRTMDWKRGRGRPRKTAVDKRKVRFF